jgi:SAM-dependent methyltransferase
MQELAGPGKVETELTDWVREVVDWLPEDSDLPGGLDFLNLTLNRRRLAEFLERFGNDSDVQDFLLLDLLGVATGSEISSTGEVETVPDLSLRPFRLWEYIWLYKVLRLHAGGKSVLDLGGPASHIVLAAGLARNKIRTVDLNPRIVEAGLRCAAAFRLENYSAEVGDMRDLSSIPSNSVDRIVCCSVLEHLTADDQAQSLSEMARLLAPGGLIGLTFDYGPAAPGVNIYLPPPHEPPPDAKEVYRRYVHTGLEVLGHFGIENPAPGSLFRTQEVSYTIAALFLAKPPFETPAVPKPLRREHSFVSSLSIPDLIVRLQEKARLELSRLEAGRVFQQAAEERLRALENADAELRRLYPELEHREELLAALSQTARLGSAPLGWKQAAELRLQKLQEADEELQRLYRELNRREEALLKMQIQVQTEAAQREHAESGVRELRLELNTRESEIEQKVQKAASLEQAVSELQGKLSGLQQEMTTIENGGILSYLRWRRSHSMSGRPR